MFGSETLEVGTGVIFFFLLVSLMCTAAREAIESLMRTRAMDLERGVRELLADAGGRGITSDMFAHPMLFSQRDRLGEAGVRKAATCLGSAPCFIPMCRPFLLFEPPFCHERSKKRGGGWLIEFENHHGFVDFEAAKTLPPHHSLDRGGLHTSDHLTFG